MPDPVNPLDAVIADYLQQVDAGTGPDRDALLAAHPDLADRLRTFFADLDTMGARGEVFWLPDVSLPEDFGDYEFLGEVGRGGMGVVYRVRQKSLGRVVALKMVLSGPLADASALRRFREEAETVSRLDHPHIVNVYEVGEHGGLPYFTMKLIEGQSLTACLNRFVDDPIAAAELLVRVCDAVRHAHERGVLHRDLKPGNVLVDADGAPHVTDFGLARRLEEVRTLTITGAVLGTPEYMAPEQAAGAKDVTTAADVYGLGAMLYALLTGRAPFPRSGVYDTLRRVVEDPPVQPRTLRPDAPRDLEAICLKCLEKEPARRYASAETVAVELQRFLAGKPVSVRPPGHIGRLYRWSRRKPALAALYSASVAAVVLVGVAGVITGLWREAEEARQKTAAALVIADDAWEKEGAARRQSEILAERLARIEYGRAIQMSYQEWQRGNIDGAADLLLGTRLDLRGWEWHYVDRLCNQLRPLRGHTGSVEYPAWSPNGKRVVTTSRGGDNTARVWEARTGREVCVIKPPEPDWTPKGSKVGPVDPLPVDSVEVGLTHDHFFLPVLIPDGTRVLLRSNYALPRIWDADTGAQVSVLKHSRFGPLSPNGDRVILFGMHFPQRNPAICDPRTGAPRVELQFREPLRHAVWNGDGSRLLTRSRYSDDVGLYDGQTGARVAVLRSRPGGLRGVWFRPGGDWVEMSFSPNGTRAMTLWEGTAKAEGSDANERTMSVARVWDATTGAELVTLKSESVHSPSWSPDGHRVVAIEGERSSSARIWDTTTGAELFNLGSASYAKWSPEGSRIVTFGYDGSRLWDPATGTSVAAILVSDRSHSPVGAWWSPDGKRLAAGFDNKVQICDAATGATLAVLKQDHKMRFLWWSPDGTHVLTTGDDHVVRVWNTVGVAEVGTYEHQEHVSWSPDGTRAVTAVSWQGMSLWDVRAGVVTAVLRAHNSPVSSGWDAAWSADGTRVVTLEKGARGPSASVWDGRTGAAVVAVKLVGEVRTASLSPDGKRLLALSWEPGETRLLDADTGAEVSAFPGHSGGAMSVSWSRDGTRALTRSGSKAYIWDVKTGADVAVLELPVGQFEMVELSPDGARVFTTHYHSGAYHARVWDARTGAPVFALTGHADRITSASWNADGTRLVTASQDRTARVWDAGTWKELSVLRGHTGHIVSVSWNPDGTRVVTAGNDRTVRLWDATAGAELLVFRRERQQVTTARWSSDGSRIVATGTDTPPGTYARTWIWDPTLASPTLLPKPPAPMPRETK